MLYFIPDSWESESNIQKYIHGVNQFSQKDAKDTIFFSFSHSVMSDSWRLSGQAPEIFLTGFTEAVCHCLLPKRIQCRSKNYLVFKPLKQFPPPVSVFHQELKEKES